MSFAQTQAERQQRLFSQGSEQSAMCPFGAQMPRHRVVERTRRGLFQYRRRRRANEPVQNDRYPVRARRCNGSGHGRNLAST
jgi:hypothetical protein